MGKEFNKEEKIDVFAHVLLNGYYSKMLEIEPKLPSIYPFCNNLCLTDMKERRKYWNGKTKQVISYANINAEDYSNKDKSYILCKNANYEILACIKENNDIFTNYAGMVPFNNIEGALSILDELKKDKYAVGIQVFTRHLGKSIADISFFPILEKCANLGLIIFLHPVFDKRKPDNNIVFSWEYELSQAMLDLVNNDIFTKLPNLKIIVHHSGAMVPFFAGRIDNILPTKKDEFKKFYVDTAILGNPNALALTISYYGIDHVIYGSDAPFGILPSGANKVIEESIDKLNLSKDDLYKIYSGNFRRLCNGK